jgi:hypothetical protein
MRTEVCIFNGQEVPFLYLSPNPSPQGSGADSQVMVSATEMAKIFDADVNEFTRAESCEKFVKALCQTENSRFDNEFTPNGVFVKIVIGGRHSGTWMDRRVALKFAAWLSPEFEVWVYSTIEELLFGKLVKREKSFERTAALQQEMEYILDKPDKTVADFTRYLEIQKQLKYEVAFRRGLTVEDLSGMKSLF